MFLRKFGRAICFHEILDCSDNNLRKGATGISTLSAPHAKAPCAYNIFGNAGSIVILYITVRLQLAKQE